MTNLYRQKLQFFKSQLRRYSSHTQRQHPGALQGGAGAVPLGQGIEVVLGEVSGGGRDGGGRGGEQTKLPVSDVPAGKGVVLEGHLGQGGRGGGTANGF